MQAIFESIFDVAYLIGVVALGLLILSRAGSRREFRLFGGMAILLGLGDSFHLIPRVWALNTTGTSQFAAALGFGTFVTSLTMTVFYLLLYGFWRLRYRVTGKKALSAVILALGCVRIALCLFPQNLWLQADAPVSWGIYRNIPFALLGMIIIVLFFTSGRKDKAFAHMWLAISLSFAFYAPVVLWAHAVPWVGAFMLPKTCAYLWMVWMGWVAAKKDSPHL